MRTAGGWMMFVMLFLWAPLALAQNPYPDRIVSVGPVNTGSSVYRATYEVVAGSSPITVDHADVRVNGNTIDLVSFADVGGFSVGGYARETQTLGALAPGAYTLRLWTSEGDFGGSFPPESLQDTVQFTAVAGTERAIPAMGRYGLMVLAALVLLMGVPGWRRGSA